MSAPPTYPPQPAPVTSDPLNASTPLLKKSLNRNTPASGPGSKSGHHKSVKDDVLGTPVPATRRKTRSVSAAMSSRGEQDGDAPTDQMEVYEEDGNQLVLYSGTGNRFAALDSASPPPPNAPSPVSSQHVNTQGKPIPTPSPQAPRDAALMPATHSSHPTPHPDTALLVENGAVDQSALDPPPQRVIREDDPVTQPYTPPALPAGPANDAFITKLRTRLAAKTAMQEEDEGTSGRRTPASPEPMLATTTQAPRSPRQPTVEDVTDEEERMIACREAADRLAPETLRIPTSTKSNSSTYHPGPFPKIYRATSVAHLNGIADDHALAWARIPGHKVYLQTFDLHCPDDHRTISTLISHIARAIENVTQHFDHEISPPLYANPPPPPGARRRLMALVFCCYNLNRAARDRLVQLGVYSSENTSFSVITPNQPIPAMLMTLEGLYTSNEATVRKAIHDVWSDDVTIQALLQAQQRLETRGRPLFTNEQIESFMTSMTVKHYDIRVRGAVIHRFNVYANGSCFDNEDQWYEVRATLRSIPYRTRLNGVGISINLVSCSLCHGIDHPRGKCPFPNLQGWEGPLHQHESQTNQNRWQQQNQYKGQRRIDSRPREPSRSQRFQDYGNQGRGGSHYDTQRQNGGYAAAMNRSPYGDSSYGPDDEL
ncbi:hypothetical protein DENSPDRAFT_852207 [Dentipellis sp. KUC8613]|nr:hypothetical protein DENSPDRAFT_852207 [Dentipellis sp. KUC8613]